MYKRNSVLCRMESQNAWTVAKKKRIYDCYGILEKVAWIWRVLALFPITIQYSSGSKKYKINSIIAVYGITMTSMCFANVIWVLFKIRHKFSLEAITMSTATLLIRSFSCSLCMIVSNFTRTFRHRELSEAIESMAAQEAFLEKIGCRLNHERIAKIVFNCVSTTLLIVLTLQIYSLFATRHNLPRIQWLLWITTVVGEVLNLTIFASFVALLGCNFRALNEKIRIIVTRANASPPKVIVESDVCAEHLRLAAKAHYNICAVGKRINYFFTFDLIINVTAAFVILSTTLYYIFVEVQKEGKTDVVRIGTYINWEIIHSVPIFIVVVICNWTTHQSTYAGTFIHEIQVETTDSRLYEALKSFSLQLHHQKLEFTGGGLFPLNSTLLQKMVGHITTYLVILIQFHPLLEND